MPFNEIAAEVGIDENNSVDETLDVDQGQDDGGEADVSRDNSQETAQDTAFDPSTITDPQLQAAYKQMQAAFTPRLQEAANLRNQWGDIDPAVGQAARVYNDLLRTDPFAAREFLIAQQQQIEQHIGMQAPQPDPYANVEPLTPTEQALLNAGRQQYQQMQQLQYIAQQHQFRAQQEAVERQFAQIETKYKTTIPLEDRHEVWEFMRSTGTRSVDAAWKALNFDKAMQKGVQKGAAVVQKKQGLPAPPTNKQQRSGAAPAAKAKGIDAHFQEAWNKYSS